MTERGRWQAARHPAPFATDPRLATREDAFNALDTLRDLLVESDEIMRSEILKALTNLRAIIATLVPAPPPPFPCPHCGLSLRSEQRRSEHLFYLHDGPEPAHLRYEAGV